jgi:hypothetical protein
VRLARSPPHSRGQRLTRARSITSFGDRPNERGAVLDYFRSHFSAAHRRRQRAEYGDGRKLYCHYTTVVVRPHPRRG